MFLILYIFITALKNKNAIILLNKKDLEEQKINKENEKQILDSIYIGLELM